MRIQRHLITSSKKRQIYIDRERKVLPLNKIQYPFLKHFSNAQNPHSKMAKFSVRLILKKYQKCHWSEAATRGVL